MCLFIDFVYILFHFPINTHHSYIPLTFNKRGKEGKV